MNTNFLDSFVAVVELGSYAAAARRLLLTPAAIAQRIRCLEAELGVDLLARAGRNVLPTPAGYAILDKARRFAVDVEDLKMSARSGRIAGTLRVGAISTALTGILPEVLSAMSLRHPQLELHVSPGTSQDLYARVTEGALDACLLVQPPFALSKSFDWRRLRQEPLLLLTKPAEAGKPPQEVLASHPFIRYDRMHWGGQLADNYLRSQGLLPIERLELDALEAIAVMVDRGLGVALVPHWNEPWPAGLSVAKTPIPDPEGAFLRSIGLLWPRIGPRTHLVQAFAAVCLDLVPPDIVRS